MSSITPLAKPGHHTGELTEEQFKEALPKRLRKNVDTTIMDKVNELIKDPTLRETYREGLLSYTSVMAEGRYKIEGYLDAVKFVSCKLLGATDLKAWTTTFPDRYQHYVNIGSDSSHIASVVNAYRKGALVNKIMEQTLVPTHVLNADLYQSAINQLANLMMNAKSDLVKSQSAAKLVDALKMPETQKVELDFTVKENDSIKELRESTLELVAQQRKMLESGSMTAQEVAHSKLVVVDGEAEVVENK